MSLLQKFTSLFTAKEKNKYGEKIEVREDYYVFRIGGVLGSTINVHGKWNDNSNIQEVVGWKQIKPRVGDLLLIKMQSGRDAAFLFAEVEYCGDPHDMFFGTVQAMAYTDELDWYEEKSEPTSKYFTW